MSVHCGTLCAASLVDRYVATAIQGDLRPALSWFAAAPMADDPVARDLGRRFDARFVAQSETGAAASGDDLVDGLVAAYRAYWVRALLGEMSEVQSRGLLEQELSNLLQAHAHTEHRSDAPNLYERTDAALRDRGFHALLGPASPLQDLLVWKSQQSADYKVELADGLREVRVHFMAGFASLGWKDYAALGLASTSGWVEQGALFCVADSYDVESETFQVSYLRHEARHLADFERFPGLSSAELEYRAKLTELSFASTTLQRLLGDFTRKSADNPDSPHAQANHRVIGDLYRELHGGIFPGGTSVWYDADRQRVNQAARRLLARDTQRLERIAAISPAAGSIPERR